MTCRLAGLQNLIRRLHEKREECKTLKTQCKGLKGSSARAESRFTQLSSSAGQSQDTMVTPGVSRKVFEALVRDNTNIQQALEHLTKIKGPNGVALAVENRELHEIILTLRNERDLKRDEVDELRKLLATVQDQDAEAGALQGQVVRLDGQVTKLKKDLDTKQVFCETIVTENESLKKDLQSLRSVTMAQMSDARTDLKGVMTQTRDKDEDEDEAEKLDKLTAELQDTEQDRDRLGNEVQHLKARLEELQSERQLMQSALKGYESDFKAEREDKYRALSDR